VCVWGQIACAMPRIVPIERRFPADDAGGWLLKLALETTMSRSTIREISIFLAVALLAVSGAAVACWTWPRLVTCLPWAAMAASWAVLALVVWGVRLAIRQRRANENTHEELRLHAAALEAAANGIAITDAQGSILWTNQAFCELTGYGRLEIIGQNHRILKSGVQGEDFYRQMWETLGRGEVWQGEMINRRKDGSHYVEENTISPLRDSGGAIRNFIAVKQNISERKSQEKALAAAKVSAERAKAAAEEASHAKDHFLAALSHELRTPLTPVVAALALLQGQGGLDEGTREILQLIGRNVDMETRLIEDLLDVTRLSRGKIELERKPIELEQVLRRVVEVVQGDIDARRLRFGMDAGDGPFIVDADATRMQQIFWNLLRNAVKFTPNGGSVRLACRKDGGRHVVVEIKDSGEGIAGEALERIFNAFEQGERAITRQFGGLGLGLTISKGLVELHGGTIAAQSDGKGQGATFRVRLPLVLAQAHVEAVPAAPPASRPLRILLVEDHDDTANIMRRLLVADGHEVTQAGDVATALKRVAQGAFDLLISDIGLPDRSGLDFIRELRRLGCLTPGIALSGYAQEEDIQRSREAGFAVHLTKPTSLAKLAAAIAAAAG